MSKQPRDFDPNKIYKDKMRVEAFIVSGKKAKDSNIDKLVIVFVETSGKHVREMYTPLNPTFM